MALICMEYLPLDVKQKQSNQSTTLDAKKHSQCLVCPIYMIFSSTISAHGKLSTAWIKGDERSLTMSKRGGGIAI